MIRIGCIGGWGHWSECFASLELRDDIEICGVAPAYDGEPLEEICSHALANEAPVFLSAEELLKTAPEVCVVSTRPGQIAESVVAAANAGCRIITEKPLGISLGQLAAVESALTHNRTALMAILSLRAHPVFQTARRLYRQGMIGDAVLLNARKSYKWKERPEWFGVRNTYGGTWPWVGIHAFDMIRFIAGISPQRMAAVHANCRLADYPDCEDAAGAVCELTGGAQATISIDYFRPTPLKTHGDDWIRIVGTEGILEARANENCCTLVKDGAEPLEMALDSADSLFDPFLDGGEALTDTVDAVELTRAALVARQAADEKVWVSMNDFQTGGCRE